VSERRRSLGVVRDGASRLLIRLAALAASANDRRALLEYRVDCLDHSEMTIARVIEHSEVVTTQQRHHERDDVGEVAIRPRQQISDDQQPQQLVLRVRVLLAPAQVWRHAWSSDALCHLIDRIALCHCCSIGRRSARGHFHMGQVSRERRSPDLRGGHFMPTLHHSFDVGYDEFYKAPLKKSIKGVNSLDSRFDPILIIPLALMSFLALTAACPALMW